MREDVERFLASDAYSDTTRESYRRVLLSLVELPTLAELDAVGLLEFVNRPTWGNSQQYVAMCACKRFLRWRFGIHHPALSARIKRVRSKRQRRLDTDQTLRLLLSFDPSTPKGSRDLALTALALDTGLRVSELCRLRLADVDLDSCSLQVIVKGGQWGYGVFSPDTAACIRGWLAFYCPAPGVESLFVSTRTGRPLTREGLQTIMKRWGERLGFRLSPHDLRRTFATLTTLNGAPTRIVQIAGRWQSIEMVELYTRDLDPAAITPYLPVSRLLKG